MNKIYQSFSLLKGKSSSSFLKSHRNNSSDLKWHFRHFRFLCDTWFYKKRTQKGAVERAKRQNTYLNEILTGSTCDGPPSLFSAKPFKRLCVRHCWHHPPSCQPVTPTPKKLFLRLFTFILFGCCEGSRGVGRTGTVNKWLPSFVGMKRKLREREKTEHRNEIKVRSFGRTFSTKRKTHCVTSS